MKNKYLVRESRTIRKVFGFVESIKVYKAMENSKDSAIIQIAEELNLCIKTTITGHCYCCNCAEGYTVFTNLKNKWNAKIYFGCTGYYKNNIEVYQSK